jgi:sugar/nucleoside kinase (ribokinase family)
MATRTEIAHSTAAALRAAAAELSDCRCLIGFDGFVDSIIDVVDERHSPDRYDRMKTIDQLGRKLVAAAGQSSNYELVTRLEKLGGNGPIMSNALATAGLPVTYVGALGFPNLHRAFEAFSQRAECVSFCEPGLTDALEFDDGKIMLGKHATLAGVSAERLKELVGTERLRQVVGGSRLLGMVNWTMLTRMDGIWDYLMQDVLPGLEPPRGGRRLVFVDLADPEKRTREDLRHALATCARFQEHADVILGYNLKEALQVADALGLARPERPEAAIEALSRELRGRLEVHTVVVHPRSGAAATARQGEAVATAAFAGPLVRHPKLSTGAGDNFNAGFCIGHLAGLSLQQSLCLGTAASGYYVRAARSGSLQELASFCEELPEPEA